MQGQDSIEGLSDVELKGQNPEVRLYAPFAWEAKAIEVWHTQGRFCTGTGFD